jgi:hypothetical protein
MKLKKNQDLYKMAKLKTLMEELKQLRTRT